MRSGTIKKLLSLLLAGTVACSCAVLGAGAAVPEVSAAGVSAAASEKVYLLTDPQSIQNGTYILVNQYAGAILTDEINPDNHSFPTHLAGALGDVAYNLNLPESYYYTVTRQSGDYYYIQNSKGLYLDIVGYGRMQFTFTPSPLRFEQVTAGGQTGINISKKVGDQEYSMSMYQDSWFTVHDKDLSKSKQCMSFYRVEGSSEITQTISRIQGVFLSGDPGMTKVASGYTESEVRTLISKAQSFGLPSNYEYILRRALALLTGTPASQLPAAFQPERNGCNKDLAVAVNKNRFYTERQPTGIWVNPGDKLQIFVTASSGDPIPSILFTQHISKSHEEKTVELQVGMNEITVPTIHADCNDYDVKVEPGGPFYIINPYTKNQQSDNVRLFITGGERIPTFGYGDSVSDFVDTLQDYYRHYQNKEKGYHNICELYSKYSTATLTLERVYEAYVTEGLDPVNTMKNWDDFIEYLMEFDGMEREQYEPLRMGVKVNQPYGGAYATSEMICIQDNNWVASFLASRYGWGFAHETGHNLDDNARTYIELTNNMWAMKNVLDHHQYDSISVRKEKPKYDLRLIAPEDQNNYWSPVNSADTTFWWCLFILWDLEVYHNGYWGELDTMFRNRSCGNSAADEIVNNSTMDGFERIAFYSSAVVGIDLTYYFKKYGYLKTPSNAYTEAISKLTLRTIQPKIYYYYTDTYNRTKGSNVGKGNIEVSAYNPTTKSMYFSVPAACAENHLGFEIVRNGKVVDFTWEYQYTGSSADGTYTINAYDTALNVYSSVTFSVNDASYSNKYTARVNGTYYKSLNEAINAAPSGSTVYLLGSTYIDSTVTLNKAVTVMPESSAKQIMICNRVTNGAGFVIGSGGSLTFATPSGSVDHTIILENAYTHQSSDTAIQYSYFNLTGGSLTLGKGVTLQNCASYNEGPAIYAKGASVNLNGCILQFNRSNKAGTVYLAEGSTLRSSNGTKIRYNRGSSGSAIYSAGANNQIYLSDTEIHDNFCHMKGASTVSVSTGSIEAGGGTSIHDNADSWYSVNSAMFVGSGASAKFSGKLNITDKVTLCTAAKVDPGVTGTLNLRADKTVMNPGFVLAVPTSGTFSQSVMNYVQYQNSMYVMNYQSDKLMVGTYTAPQVSFSASPASVDVGNSCTLSCSVSGGSAPYQYRFEVKKSTDSGYTVLKAYSTASSYTWKPTAAGSYTLRVQMKDARGTVISKTASVTVKTPDVRNASTISATTIKLGASVTVTCSGSGGVSPYTYSVVYKKSTESSYTTAMSYGTNTKATIKPASAGTYSVVARVNDKNGTVTSKTFSLTVTASDLVNNSTVSALTVTKGSKITVTCKASGGTAPYTYAVYYKEKGTSSYTKIRDFSSDTAASFTPKYAKNYTLKVRAKDKDGNSKDKNFSITVIEPPVMVKVTLSATTITLGESIKVTSSVTGAGTMKYAVYYKKSTQTSWTTAKAFSASNTATVTPQSSGSYQIVAKAKDGSGNIIRREFSVKVNPALKNTSTVSHTTISYGTSVKVTCASTGGTGTKQYAVYYKKSTQTTWTKAKGYSTTTSATIKPKHLGSYTVRVKVRDNRNNVVRKSFTVKVTNSLKNTSTVSAAAITRGGSVKVTCGSTGGVGTIKYAVYYKKSTQKKWTKAKDYSTTKTATVTPNYSGDYTIRVKAKDANGTIVNKNLAVHVNKALTNSSAVSAPSVILGKSVTVTCASGGGTGTKKYAVYYKRKAATEWTKAQGYSTNKTVTVTPKHVSDYTVRVKVKDTTGKVTKKDLTVTVYKAMKNTSKLSATTIQKGQTVTVSCSSTGGYGTKQYAVFYKKKDASSWIKARDYGTGTSVKVTPKYAASYVVRVKAKDANGKIVNKDLFLTVESPNTLTNTSKAVTASVSAGGTVKLNLTAEKGKGPYSFRIEKMKAGDTSWTLVKDYSSITTVSVKLPKKGTYQIKVIVKDKAGTKDTKYITVSAI